jgi:RNA polymerase sigma factor (sigma-70 family)
MAPDDRRQKREDVGDILRRLTVGPRDPEAWEDFFVRLWPYVLATAHRLLESSPQRMIDAEDVAQETFIRFARFWHAGQGERPQTEGQLRALLSTMTRHQAGTARRLLLRERRDARRDRPLPEDGSVADVRPLAQALVEFDDLLRRILAELAPEGRRLVPLLLAGHTEMEIAKLLGVSDRTVRRQLGVLRETIRKQLAAYDLG